MHQAESLGPANGKEHKGLLSVSSIVTCVYWCDAGHARGALLAALAAQDSCVRMHARGGLSRPTLNATLQMPDRTTFLINLHGASHARSIPRAWLSLHSAARRMHHTRRRSPTLGGRQGAPTAGEANAHEASGTWHAQPRAGRSCLSLDSMAFGIGKISRGGADNPLQVCYLARARSLSHARAPGPMIHNPGLDWPSLM